MKKLKIDQVLFSMAFNIDVDYQPCQDEAYLCKETGEVLFLPDKMSQDYDSSCDENHEVVAKNPDRYLRIRKTTHGEHHEVLTDFLSSIKNSFIKNSDSFSESEIEHAYEAYYSRKSVGFWKKQVSEEMYYAYKDFREKVLKTEADEWLRKNGIEVEWK